MRISYIKIVFEDEDRTVPVGENIRFREISAEFKDGEWSIDGPIYSRILLALHDVWQRLRQEVKNG